MLYTDPQTAMKDMIPIGHKAAAEFTDTAFPVSASLETSSQKTALLITLLGQVHTCIEQIVEELHASVDIERMPVPSERPIIAMTASGEPYTFKYGQEEKMALDGKFLAMEAMEEVIDAAVLLLHEGKNILFSTLVDACGKKVQGRFLETGLCFPVWAKKNPEAFDVILGSALQKHKLYVNIVPSKGALVILKAKPFSI